MTCTDIILTISIDIYLDGDFPDESSTLSKLSKKSKPRSRSVDRDRSTKAGAGGRSVSVSEDSGNSSLNTYATDTIQTRDSDWVTAPQRLAVNFKSKGELNFLILRSQERAQSRIQQHGMVLKITIVMIR